jgi:S-adenosylmethionine/arginine decarboxylase-like enzyme
MHTRQNTTSTYITEELESRIITTEYTSRDRAGMQSNTKSQRGCPRSLSM